MTGRGWTNTRPRMGLNDAYEIADRPRTAPETPQIIKDWFARAESEERSIFHANTQHTEHPESDLTSSTWSVSPRDPSPTPAPTRISSTYEERRAHTIQPERDLTGSTWSVSPRDPIPTPAPMMIPSTYEDIRPRLGSRPVALPKVSSTYEERRALMKRIANNPRPAFKPRLKPKSVFERYRRDNPLQPIAPLEPEPEPEPLEHIPQSRGIFTPPSSQEQSPEKTWNDGFDFTAGHSIVVSNSPVLQEEEIEEPEQKGEELEEPEQKEERPEELRQKEEELEEPEQKEELEEEEVTDEMRDVLRRLSRVSISPAPERAVEDPEERITAEAKLFEAAEKSGPPSDDGDDNAEEPTTERHGKPTLATAAEDLRDLQIEAGIEDSTTVDDPLNDPIHDNIYNNQIGLTISEQERRIERLFLARMEQRLRNASTSLRDTRHGIERLEKEVSLRDPAQEGEYIHIHIKLPVPKWRFESPRGAGTLSWWFLLMLMLFVIWYVAESVTCSLYCKPVYSSHGGWSPSDPVFPWALPTKMYQMWGDIGIGV
ncbi:hypothetical protein BDZ45DRAFT_415013 [Acephala macrosclerotiorum]|nr:hypothetical protein BDZ45DRAFT_415013 [Acephala macrosclerotiorum]